MRIVRIVIALLVVAPSLFAQPFGQYLKLQGFPQRGYIEIPHDVLLDTPAMTVEAWVSIRDANGSTGCSSIAGKGFTTGWWLGLCGTTMRSYFNSSTASRTAASSRSTSRSGSTLLAMRLTRGARTTERSSEPESASRSEAPL